MQPSRAITIVLLGILLSLRVLAEASPPDPTWLPGFWDGGDHDDVIVLVDSTVTTSGTEAPSVAPSWAPVRIGVPPDDKPAFGTAIQVHRPRSPPLDELHSS